MIVKSSSISVLARASILVACCAAATAADAQSRSPVPFLNNPAPEARVQSSGFYQETKSAQSPKQCGSVVCTMTFSEIPATKVLVITNVNCVVTNDKGGPVFGGVNDDGSAGAGLGFSSLGFFSTTDPQVNVYVSNEPVLLLLLAGHTPEIQVVMGTQQGRASAECTISGDLN